MTLAYKLCNRPRERDLQWSVEMVRDEPDMPLITELTLGAFQERRHAEMFLHLLESEEVTDA